MIMGPGHSLTGEVMWDSSLIQGAKIGVKLTTVLSADPDLKAQPKIEEPKPTVKFAEPPKPVVDDQSSKRVE
jgi:hypothetical protein